MAKYTGFDYLGELEKRAIQRDKDIYNYLKNIDGHFCYVSEYYKDKKPVKITNPRILLQFERGGMENSYINIFLGDYDNKKEPELIGFYCVKDYFKECATIYNFMYILQKCIFDLQDSLFFEVI